LNGERSRIAALAATTRLPWVAGQRKFAEAGLTSMPVTFPPGRASLAIKPKSNGVRHRTDHDRHRCCGPLQNESRRRDLSHNDVWLQTNQLFCECGQSFQKSVGVSLHKIDVPIFEMARFMQPLEETVSISREA
jgi:hypothetical protein